MASDEAKYQRDCLHNLQSTEASKDKLLEDSYVWILDNPAFQRWRDNDETQLLWIKGDPGKGKTMLMIGQLAQAHARMVSHRLTLRL